MEHDLNILKIYTNHKIKNDNFDPYNVFLAFATNILQRLLLCSRDTYNYYNCIPSVSEHFHK